MQANIHPSAFALKCSRGRPYGFARCGFQFHFAQEREAGRAGPDGFLALNVEHQRRAGSGYGLFFSERENGRRVFDGAAESVPIGDRDAVGDARRDLAEVEHDDAESAGVEQVIGGFERVPGVVAATDPDQLRESDAGCGGRYGIERIVGIDVSADLKLGGGCGQQGMDERGAAGAFRAEDLRDGAAREAFRSGHRADARPVGRHSRILASGRSPSVVTRAAFGFMQFRLFFATHILLSLRWSCQEYLGLRWVRLVICTNSAAQVSGAERCGVNINGL